MAHFLQALLGGLTSGSIYALVGLGVSMIFGVSRVLNLAQGEFVALGGLMTYALYNWLKLPLFVAVIVAALISAVIGIGFERFVIRPSKSKAMTVLLVITVGFSVLIKGVAMVVFGKDPKSLPAFSGEEPVHLWELTIPRQTLWVFGAMIFLSALSWYFFERTSLGKALLASADNKAAAQMVGIDVHLMNRLAFGLTALIGALGGALIAPITFVTFDGGTMIGLKGFVAATVGGMGNMPGAFVGGLLLGVLEAIPPFLSAYVGSGLTLFKDAIAFIVLIIVLLVRSGLDKRSTLLSGG